MKTVTIGREFGSGGREFGKKLAQKLGYQYFDREIILEIAAEASVSEEYVERLLEKRPPHVFAFHAGMAFSASYDPNLQLSNSVYAKQTEVIRDMASRGNAVIVGRCADYILRDRKPFRIFVYSDKEHRVARCRSNALENEQFSDKELWKKILAIDKDRRKYYTYFTGQKWGDKKEYDLCINTAVGSLDEWVDFVASLITKLT